MENNLSNKDITVYMIGNAHIDPVWLWDWREGFAEVMATCRSALDRMEEYPDFVFTRADAATYRWIEDASPEMFEEIRQRVREGRWNIVGGWWEQPDCNIPSGESFVRHELYGKRYFLDKFGVDVNIGYNVDSFGHSAGLPQILKRAGIDYYVFMRPGPHEKDIPESVFWWEGPDGSRVLTMRLPEPYAIWSDFPQHIQRAIDERPAGTTAAVRFYGVGNHGGGPTVGNIEAIRALQADADGPKLTFGTLGDFLQHVQKERSDFPVVKGDLQHHAVGCYTAHSEIKRLVRRAENALGAAERFCVMAKLALGRQFPKQKLAETWQKVLFNQFHDIMAGTSIQAAYDDVRDTMGAAIDTASYEANAAMSAIAWKLDVCGEGDAFVVFNPHIFTAKCPVYVDENTDSLQDCAGRSVAIQSASSVFEHTGPRQRKVFVDTLPSFGYRLYYANRSAAADHTKELSVTETLLENEAYRVDIDPTSGQIMQITDKRTGKATLRAPARAIVVEDKSDTWSHGVVAFNQLAGSFGDARTEVVESGPVRATVRIESKFGDSTLWQDVSLYADLPRMEWRVTVDWHEKHRMLKFEFPLDLQDPTATYDAAYATVTYPTDGAENPGQKWVDVSDANYGVSLINDSKYGFDVEGSTMRLSALRSPIYAFHDPRQVEEGKRYIYIDQGLQSFTFALIAHEGSWQDSKVYQEAQMLNMPPSVVEVAPHAGRWTGERAFAWINAPTVDLCAIKEAEDDDSLICRLYETAAKNVGEAKLTVNGTKHILNIGPSELKTLKISQTAASEVDLIERQVS